MIRQRQPHAVAQLRFRQFVARIQQDCAIAAILQIRIPLAKRLDQICLAVKVDRALPGNGLDLIDADGAAALAFRGEVARLAPFQRFLDRADAFVDFAVSTISLRSANSFVRTGLG
jgi:hypothetical protein